MRQFNILRDALGSFDDLRSHLYEIASDEKVSLKEALEILSRDLAALSKEYGLQVYASSELWGEMYPYTYLQLGVADLIDEKGDIAGPPYLYVHWEDSAENVSAFLEMAEGK